MSTFHVLLVASSYPPAHGGGQLRVHRTYRRLRSRWPVRVQTLTRNLNVPRTGPETFDRIPVYRLRSDNPFPIQFFEVGHHLRRAKQHSVDLVHCLGANKFVLAGAIWARMLGIPYIFELTKTLKSSLSSNDLRSCTLRHVIHGADLLISINQLISDDIRSIGVPEDRIWTRPNPVQVDQFHPAGPQRRQAARAELNLTDDDLVHLLIGGFSPRKNQAFALRSVRRLPDRHKLILAGPADEHPGYMKRIRKAIDAWDLSNRVRVHDRFVDDVERLYHAADCCWIPSKREGLPNVMLEALCCGVPVIANENLGLSNHIEDGVNGMNVPLDVQFFAGAIRELEPALNNHEHRRAFAEEARARYRASKLDREFYNRLTTFASDG